MNDSMVSRAAVRRAIYRRRRAACVWLPLIGIGAVVNAWASTLTLTINGLNVVAMLVLIAGAVGLARDWEDRL